MTAIQEAAHTASTSIATVFGKVENLQAIDKIILWTTRFFEGIAKYAIPMGLSKLTQMVSVTEAFINGAMLWTFGRYFFHINTDVKPKLGELNGKVYQADSCKAAEKEDTTSFLYQLKNKTHMAVANIGYALAYITCAVSLLESFSIPVLATISDGIGMIPVIGKSIGEGIASHFYSLGGFALIAAHSAMVLDSIRYIYLCSTDSSKSLTKGIIQLMARVASLAFDILLVSHVANPIVLGVAGLGAGIMGVISAIYLQNRALQKEEKQKELLHLGVQQNPPPV